jgi:hypothetical protein
MFTWIAAKLGSTLAEYLVGGAVIALLAGGGYLYISHLHSAKVKAEAKAAAAVMGLQIGYEGYVKLYQEREAIKAKADQQRRKLNEMRQANDLDGLTDDFNNPGGVRRPVQPNPKGGVKAPARYRDADGTGASYQEAP